MRRSGGPLLAVAVFVSAIGCTMCPDPFDYSGPVPNGSAAQNDFCARSNGILPLNAAPSPWPPVVDGADGRAVPLPEAESHEGISLTAGEAP